LAAIALIMLHQALRSRVSAKTAWYRCRYRGRLVDPSCLDEPGRRQLARVQRAVREISGHRIYQDGAIDSALIGTILAEHEWEIACTLRDACMLRETTALISSAPEAAHPAVQEILRQHSGVLGRVGLAVSQRIQDLEAYAAAVLAADLEYCTWLLATAAAQLNDRYLDLLASAPAHGRTGQVARLAAEARAAEDSFRQLIADPDAAPPLALPDEPCPGNAA
jgi:hypothetical protein